MKNCCKEGCSLPSSNNQSDILLDQLKREVEELMKTTQAKLLCQDKKIAETCVYIKNNLSNAILDLLNSMEQSGELDEIILNTITDVNGRIDELESKNLVLDFNRTFRHMAICRANRQDGDLKNNTTGFCQSMVDLGNTLMFAEVCNWKHNNNAHFVEVYKDTWEIKREFDLQDVGHVSSIAYNKCTNELYVLPFYYNVNGNSVNTNDLKIYDYTTLAYKKKVVLPIYIAAITYDNVNNKMYGASNSSVYQILSNYGMTKLFDYPNTDTIQGIAMYDNHIYILKFSSTYIAKYNLIGELKAYIPIERYYGFNFIGEPEGIAIDENGDLFISTCSYHAYTYYYCNQIFKTNVKENIRVTETRSGSTQNSIAVTVGTPTSNNPDGTSGNPFGTLCEAILCLNSPVARNMGMLRITLTKDCPEETLYWRGGFLSIYGSYTIGQINITDCDVYINATKVVNQSDMLLEHNTYLGRCRGIIHSITSTQNYGSCNINLDYSQIRINNATLNGNPTEGRIRAVGGEVYGTTKAVNEAIYGNSQMDQKVPESISSVNSFVPTTEQKYQLSNVFTNLSLFCSLSDNNKTIYSGTNAKLTTDEMNAIKNNGSFSKYITCDFVCDSGAYIIGCTLNYSNGQFLLSNFKSYLITNSGVTEGTKQFIIINIEMN